MWSLETTATQFLESLDIGPESVAAGAASVPSDFSAAPSRRALQPTIASAMVKQIKARTRQSPRKDEGAAERFRRASMIDARIARGARY